MKKTKSSKKVVAVVLAIALIISSLPFMLFSAAGGAYDPAPKFSDAAIREGARAWLDDDGNVQVEYPAAEAEPTFTGEQLSIAFYILELVDMGPKNAVHTDKVIGTVKATGTSGTFLAADIGGIDLANRRYSVTITAVDTQNWFSLPLYTTVTDVPVAEIDASRFANFSTSATAVREIMTFEEGTDDGAVTQGSQLLYMGVAAETGTEDLSDNVGDTSALRFIVNDQPTGTQAFDTSYSRQTWDFNGAEEMWYWMDLSKVELQGVSFRLRTNEKMWIEWKDGTIKTTQRAGETIYSTKGTAVSTYTGEDPYVWVQRDDGGWDKVMMTNGTVDLGHFKGYVRVPLKFMCSETATYVDISNQEFGQKKSFTSGINNTVNESNAFSWMAGMTFSQKVLVDNAGTPISDALLIHRRGYKTGSGFLNAGTKHTFTWNINGQTHYTEDVSSYDYSKIGYMLAMPLDEDSAKTSVTTGNASTDRAYISGTTVMNREAGLKAIEDIYNAGFAFENCTADSLQNSFFIDNIFFYRSDGGAYSENTLDGNVNTGNPMSTYYDEEAAISKIIFDEIDKHISDPDWADYRQLEYILELIEEYRALYVSQGKDTTFLNLTRQPDTTGLAGMAATHNRTETWEKAWLAYEACAAEGTIDASQANITDWFISNGDKYDLVPSIVNTMEKLPHPDNITAVSEALRKEIVKLWQAYSLLNLGQLEMLGADQEATLIKYFALVENLEELDGDEFVVGQRLADNPFIVFNDFENFMLGETAWQLEDNKDAYTTSFTSKNGSVAGTSNLANDWRHTKSLVTYTTNGSTNITDKDYYGYVTTDSDKSQEAMDGKVYYNASTATITNDGYLHSKGVNLYSDSSFTTSEQNGTFHTITITKDGQPIGTNYENNMVSEQLGGLAQAYTAAASTSVPLALIFYVDFTQIENFYFTVNVFTRDGDGNHVKCRVNTGLNNADRKYWILDNETGEWEIIYTTNQWVFNSAGNQEESANQGVDYNKIEGYKGYLMIPLYHIKKYNSLISEDKLDENATLLNNIFAIQFCVGGASATDMDEKSIIIDNVGFTYSKDSYSMASIRNDPSYAQVFGAKSLPALNFEAAVDAIDPYDEATIASSVQAAQAIYDTLPEYQKNVVEEAYKEFQLYVSYVNNPASIPQEAVSAADAVTWIQANLDSKATGASVTGEYDLTHPGFVVDSNGQVVPNYAAYGLTADLAATLRDFYNNSYIYYSKAEKQLVNEAGFLNAYNAAMRCLVSLEDIKSDSLTFLPEITKLYTVKYDYNDDGVLDDEDDTVADGDSYKIGNFISIEGRAEVETFKTDKYDKLQYYSKTSIDDGSIYPQLTNTSRGFNYFLNNTRTFDLDGDGTADVQGGIITFKNKLQEIYDNASTKIANKERLTEEELQEIKDTLEEYNNFLPAYYNIEELYELEQKILRLFPVSDMAIMDAETGGNQLTSVALNNDDEASMKKTVYLDMTYIATLLESSEIEDLVDVNTSVTLQAVSDLKLTQTTGTTYSALNSFTVSGMKADTVLDLGEYDNLEPNETFTRLPFDIAVDSEIAAKAPTGSVFEGSITFNIYKTEDIEAGLTGDDLVPLTTLELPVVFTSTNGSNPITYKVEIPMETTIGWDTTAPKDMSYTIIEANLEDGTLLVGVDDSNDDGNDLTDMTSIRTDGEGVSYKLDYDEANFKTSEFTGSITTETKPQDIPTITIKQEYWDAVPVGEYKTTLTYTVAYEEADNSTP